jgi:diguanylate cyclase (GGDEF)-like protein
MPDATPAAPPGLTPRVLVYAVVVPMAFVVFLAFRALGLLAPVPPWAFAVAIGASALSALLMERWNTSGPGTLGMHARIFVHVAGVTGVIYLSGWGPVLGMAYAFSAFAEMEQSGARTWRAALGWSIAGCAVGQALVALEWAPTMLDMAPAMTIGFLGACMFGITIRMAGAVGEDRERAEAKLAHQAMHDALTGLPNRHLFVDRLEHTIERARRSGGARPAVMFLDLDRFKLVNDTLGHQAGDALLVEVARRLREVMRASDTLARLGGDEFVVLCEAAGEQGLAQVAARVRAVFEEPFVIDGKEADVGVSIGVAAVADGETTADTLLSEADAAMYFAKQHGNEHKVQVIDDAVRTTVRDQMRIHGDLVHALDRGELVLHYQPIVEVATRRIVGVEALLRWEHPERGLLLPGEFLEAAERSGLIVRIGEWVLTTACATVASWNRALPPEEHLHLALNLSPRQLAEPAIVERTASLLAAAGIDPAVLRLSFELAESWVAVEPETAIHRLADLHGLGVTLAIDDFGTGSSSLAYVRDLPVRAVKIDRGFVAGLGRRERDRVLVRGVIRLAHELGVVVVAEGVETEEQYRELVAFGCDYAQGFLLGTPQPAEATQIHTLLHRAEPSTSVITRSEPELAS